MRRCPARPVGGMFSVMPDTCWVGGLVANTGPHELRSIVVIEPGQPASRSCPPIGSASHLQITGGTDCRIEVYRCLRRLAAEDRPTWRASRRRAGPQWSAPGAGGSQDSRLIGAVTVSADMAAALGGEDVLKALQSLAAGEQVWLVLRRADVGPNVAAVTVQCEIERSAGARIHV